MEEILQALSSICLRIHPPLPIGDPDADTASMPTKNTLAEQFRTPEAVLQGL
jgi:hypothetical protein